MARETEGQSNADRAETKQWERGKKKPKTQEKQHKESKKDTQDWEAGKQKQPRTADS